MSRKISFAFTVAFNLFLYFSKVPSEFEIHPENQRVRGEYNTIILFTLDGFLSRLHQIKGGRMTISVLYLKHLNFEAFFPLI